MSCTPIRASLIVAGNPSPKGSRVVGTRRDGSHFTREASPGVASWIEAVAYCARANRPGGKPLDPPYVVELAIRMPRPKRPKYDYPATSDIDKLCRGCLDGLVDGGLLLDDRHVVELRVSKAFGTPGVTVSVY